MKIIIPLDEYSGPDSQVCDHFGSAPFFATVDMAAGEVSIIDNQNAHHDHGQCTPADNFAGIGASAIVVKGIGARAAAKMQSLGMEVYMAGPARTLVEVIEGFGSGILNKLDAQQTCQGHGCH
ncbi:dinitrogenase iron-molybdenum cofactor biosynthesis protein [Chlorobaculum thiosulfatiphilum]|jgi:predicted Fe-Mo cluster-binding NifX family protein|uniref:Dinitrogenase iron-molybdenum cofactor biosynthesis protein n=1 Tax=Chlorobaculum thiosulfatiphilum TaxID=115852 RepID=A0A5C4S9U1_CHLTI|nr:NifB/NifX family molybdenum-iron cluster-binding protein [Chlorobaculum thiosulfatiphilum]TNJ40320.1 dinitrogenase iron-molybdenum cofactor biosynthesis protein [Chlorobaculum thiosulfatiphilum]